MLVFVILSYTLVIYLVWLRISGGSRKAAHQYVVSSAGIVTCNLRIIINESSL